MTKKAEPITTVADVMVKYIDIVRQARSEHTARAYKNALNVFNKVLVEKWLDPQNTPIQKLTEDLVSPLAVYLKNFAPATEHLYLQAIKGFYEYVDAERYTEVNLSRVRNLIRQRARRPGIRLPQFPADDIERVLESMAGTQSLQSVEDANEKLRASRYWLARARGL